MVQFWVANRRLLRYAVRADYAQAPAGPVALGHCMKDWLGKDKNEQLATTVSCSVSQ
jgi:hypothetical protein